MSTVLHPTAKILVIKLADLGDVLTVTPALRALRETFPQATIDLLLAHHTVPALVHSALVDNLIPSNNFRFFSLQEALHPGLLSEGLVLLRQVHQKRYDAVVVLHHLTTRAGALKYAVIARASGAPIVAGLKPPDKRGKFFTHAVADRGFGARHEIEYWLDVVRLLGAHTDNQMMELAISPADIDWANRQLQQWGGARPLVVIHPGSGGFSTARRWRAENFAAVADGLIERGAQVALVGTSTDSTDAVRAAMHGSPIDLTGKTTLHQLAALLRQAQLFIGGDSGVSHIAAASGVSMVSIFGPTNAAAWGATGDKCVVLQADVPCGPCTYVGHTVGLREGCAARTCLKLITPSRVLAAAEALLANAHSPAPAVAHPPEKTDLPSATILGVRLHAVTFKDALAQIETFIRRGTPHQVCTVNPEFVVAAQHDTVFRRIINRAALAFADGAGLLKAARWLNQPPLPERVAGVDMVAALAALSAEKGYRIFFLGAQPGVAEKTIAVLRARYPKLVAVGAYAGSPSAEDEDDIVARIQAAQPDIVLVAYGAPRQDKWIARNLHRLPSSVSMGVGGAFDFISGTTQRAPHWMQRLNLEWLHRFIKQPWRWRRMWNAVPRFLWLVLLEKFDLRERTHPR